MEDEIEELLKAVESGDEKLGQGAALKLVARLVRNSERIANAVETISENVKTLVLLEAETEFR